MDIKIQYKTTEEDHIAVLGKYVAGSIVGRQFGIFAYFTVCGLSWLSAILFYINQGHHNYGYLIYAAIALLLTLLLPKLYQWYQVSFWKSVCTPTTLEGIIGEKELTLFAGHVEEKGTITTLRASWDEIAKIEQDAFRIYLFLAPMVAIVIPAHAFENSNDRVAFTQELQRRIAKYHKIDLANYQ